MAAALRSERELVSLYESEQRSAERAARWALRLQIAKIERDLAEFTAEGFPHLAPTPARATPGGPGSARLLDLDGLERTRDELAGMLQLARSARAQRTEQERRSRELLERMKAEPGHYKFVRLPVRDLGQGGCGVWEVRPRLGLIGMLAGWWQVKLSSGCPLAGGHAVGVARKISHGHPGGALA